MMSGCFKNFTSGWSLGTCRKIARKKSGHQSTFPAIVCIPVHMIPDLLGLLLPLLTSSVGAGLLAVRTAGQAMLSG